MDGTTDSYLELAALAAIGATLVDPRPAFVFAADGTRLLYANPAACDFLGLADVEAALALRFSDLNPVKVQAARLARLAPSETARLEMLRFGQGVAVATLAAACRRLNLDDGTRALLAVAAGAVAGGSLIARAERLAMTLGSGGRLVAVLGGNDKLVAASAGYEKLAPDSDAIRALTGEIAKPDARMVTRSLRFGRDERTAAALRFTGDGRELFLVVIGAADRVAPEVAEADEAAADAVGLEVDSDLLLPELEAQEAEAAADVGEAAAPAAVNAPETATAAAMGVTPVETTAPAEASATPVDAGQTDSADAAPASQTPAEVVAATGVPAPAPQELEVPSPVSSAARSPEPEPEASPPDAVAAAPDEHDAAVDLDEAARHSIERGQHRRHRRPRAAGGDIETEAEAAEPVPPEPPPEPSNVVRLPAGSDWTPPERLTGTERDAFRRIAEALGARRASDDAAAPPPPPPPARKEIVKAPVSEIDTRLLDRLPIGVAIFRERRTLFANRTLIEMLDHESFDAFVAAGGAEAIFPGGEGIAGSIVEAGGRLAAIRSDGVAVPVQAWLHAVSFAGATALMLSLDANIARDTGDEDSLALARMESRADELEAILDTATDGVVVFDGRGRIGTMNRAAEALFGVSGADYSGRYFTDLLADESQKAALDYLDGLRGNGVASVLNDGREVIGRVPQGGLIPLFMTIGRIGASDKFCAVLRDITYWKNVEAELTAARRTAEAANAQKSDFLAKISHEIRTPLNAIIGFSEVMMSERFGPIENQRYRDYLRDINVSGAHLLSLINDLLDLSKIEAGKVDLAFDSVPVNAAIQECVALMQPQANRERIIIRTSLAADVPSVVADQRSLRQILLNLMSNAVKFTRAGGQVIVSSSLEASGEVVVRIRDTGIGMNEKDLETALKPFRQVAPADRDHGTGLGLPLTKALVEANRAAFAIESAPGQGTVVRITFPTTRVLAG